MSDDEIDLNKAEANNLAKIKLPRFKEKTSFYDYEDNIDDYENMESLAEATNNARLALFKVTEAINEAERKSSQAKVKYERAYRRFYLSSNEKPDSARRLRAELKCEQYEDEMIAQEQLKNELSRVSNALRLELQTLQGIGNNLRQQMRM